MFIRKQLLLFALLFVSVQSFAGKLEKAFERLSVFDYFAAKEYFEKSMKGDPAAAAYGLAKVFSVNNNPFYSIDSARKYIVLSDSLFPLQKDKVKEYYLELGVTYTTIKVLSDVICTDAYTFAENEETSKAYNHFIDFYNSCAQTEVVIELRNGAAFAEAKTANTSEAFKDFMTSYPLAVQFDRAHKKFDELVYLENTDSTIESYHFFIQNFPENPYCKQAHKMIYVLSVPDKTIEQYAAFARKYKSSPHYNEAWQEVYNLGMINFSAKTYDTFRRSYPDYPFMEELETDYKLQNTFFMPFKLNDSWGYLNDSGKVVISPSYEEASFFKEGLAAVSLNEKYGYITKAGKISIDFQFEDAELFHNYAAIVKKDSLYGVIDKSGTFLIQPVYDELAEANDNIYMAVKNEKTGYISRSGDSLTAFIFDLGNDFIEGRAIVSENEKFGIVDTGGEYIIKPVYDELAFISDRFLKAMNNDEMWGMITLEGDTLLPFDYDAIGEFSERRALVAKNGKCGFIDEGRSQIIPQRFPYTPLMLTTAKFEKGFALIKQRYNSILIDSTGKAITFKGVEDYGRPSQGFFPVRKNAKWGFANAAGKIIIPCKYQTVDPVSNGLAVFSKNKLYGVIDTSGKEIIPPIYTNIILSEKSIIVKNAYGSGLFSRDGALIFPCEYESIEFIRPDIVKASSKSGFKFVNLDNGTIIYSSEQ